MVVGSGDGSEGGVVVSGMVISAWSGTDFRSVGDVVDRVRLLADAGFDGVWVPQTFTVDTMTALAVAAHDVPDVAIGTAVVPIQGRHPIPLALQALSVVSAAGAGRFTLGLGVTHRPVSEGFFGVPYDEVVGLCRETIEVLDALFSEARASDHAGPHVTAHGMVMSDAPAPGLVLAALAPRMLAVAGALSDGTVTWMTGPTTLREVVVPAIAEAADRAGRPSPRVIAGLPVCVTGDIAAARDAVRPRIEGAAAYASYQRQLAREGLEDLAELAVVGDADTVTERLAALADLGVTELMADVFGTPEERAATTELLTGLARRTAAR